MDGNVELRHLQALLLLLLLAAHVPAALAAGVMQDGSCGPATCSAGKLGFVGTSASSGIQVGGAYVNASLGYDGTTGSYSGGRTAFNYELTTVVGELVHDLSSLYPLPVRP